MTDDRIRPIVPIFDTLAVLDAKRKTKDAGVTLPTEEGVRDAKKWVDLNEK